MKTSEVKRLSIIVPVFNTEKYLSRCLYSLISQDIPYSNYEIIVINDGSNDNSMEIAESFAKNYQNIILIDKDHVGVGAARNVGIIESTGRYLLFVDSDDYILPNCLKNVLDCIEIKNLDILRFNYLAVDDKGKTIAKTKNSTHSIIFSEEVVNGETFLTEYLGWACYVVQFLISAYFIKKNRLLFNESIYFEDVDWTVRVMMIANRVQSINKQIYVYYQRTGSITRSIDIEGKNKVLNDKLLIINTLKRLSYEKKDRKIALWFNGLISLTIMGILDYVENELPKRKIEIIKLLINQRYFPLKSYRFTWKQKRDLVIINLSPSLYCQIKKRDIIR